MHKAQKEIKEILPNVDLIIEVLDARLPFSSENPMIGSLRGDKPCIKILNKSDLADPDATTKWQNYLEQKKNVKTLALSIEKSDKLKQLSALCRKLVPNKGDNVRSLNVLIMGIPNVGKSTLINALADRTIAKTGNEPAVTKTQQRINLRNGIILIDTPGLLWPNLENKNSGYRLGITGAIKDTALEYGNIADFTAELFLEVYPENLKDRYEIELLPEQSYELLELIGKKRGCLSGGGQIDFDKTGKIFIGDLRSGALGRVTLETPEMMEKELAELAIVQEEKAAKKAARKEKFKHSRKR
jgi:ribosome biogenesis GTPase A